MARYRLLETVRQYGRERLAEADEEARLARCHAEHFLSMVEKAAPHLVGGPRSIEFAAGIVAEHDNLRAAVSWAIDQAHIEIALRFVGAIFWFWYAMGQFREALQLTDRALALSRTRCAAECEDARSSRVRLTALAQGDYTLSRCRLSRKSIPLLREAGDVHSIAVARRSTAPRGSSAAIWRRRFRRSRKSLELAKGWPVARHRRHLRDVLECWAAYAQGDYDRRERAARRQHRGRAPVQPADDARARPRHDARIELARGNVETACASVMEGLEVELAINDGWGIGLALDVVGVRRGAPWTHHEEAVRLLAGIAAHRERLAVALPSMDRAEHE